MHKYNQKGWIRRAFSPTEDEASSMWNREQWATKGQKIDTDDALWKQYLVMVDLYKYYLEAAWKVAVGYYAATGLVLAYYMDKIGRGSANTLLPLVLIFIAAMSLGFAYIGWRGARNLGSLTEFLEYIAVTLRIPGRPHVEFAIVFFTLNSVMLTAIAVGCIVLFLLTS